MLNYILNALPLFDKYPWASYLIVVIILYAAVSGFLKWRWPDKWDSFVDKLVSYIVKFGNFIKKFKIALFSIFVVAIILLLNLDSFKLKLNDITANRYYLVCVYVSPDNNGSFFAPGDAFVTKENIAENRYLNGRFKKSKAVIRLDVNYLSVSSVRKLKDFEPDDRDEDKKYLEKWRGRPYCSEMEKYDIAIKDEYYSLLKNRSDAKIKTKNGTLINLLPDHYRAISRDSSNKLMMKYWFVDQEFKIWPREVAVGVMSVNSGKTPKTQNPKLSNGRPKPSGTTGTGDQGSGEPNKPEPPTEQPRLDYNTQLRNHFEDAAQSRRGFSSQSGLLGFAHGSEATIFLSGSGDDDGKNITCALPKFSDRRALAQAYCTLLDDEGGPLLRRKVGQILDKVNDGKLREDVSVVVRLFRREE